MAETTFVRKSKYKSAIDDVSELLNHYGNGILPIPSTDAIICYYQGKPLVTIKDSNWSFFGSGYENYFLKEIPHGDTIIACKKQCRTKKAKHNFYINYKTEILSAIARGLPKDKERFSQQDIILRTLNSAKGGYFLCGMETVIPTTQFAKSANVKKKPEIDMVAINPNQKKLLLIEYKCTRNALLGKTANIYDHAKDYGAIKDWAMRDKSKQFVVGMLQSYRLLCEIYGRSYDEANLCADDYSIEIVFLLTNYPSTQKCSPSTQPLTKNDYKCAQVLLRSPDVVTTAENSYYLTYDRPEDIQHFPEDILSNTYKGIDKLCWNEDWNR